MAIGSSAQPVLAENRAASVFVATVFSKGRIDIAWSALARNEPSSIATNGGSDRDGPDLGEGMPEQRILLVEDDEDVGEVLKIALLEEGYTVDFAGTAAEAWRHLAVHRYALVLSDWRLP